ncbi:MAG: metallophosphoesterase [Phycisphaera sp.]|nr:metallophosphoesterase [Phycisphaera sp.]
MRTAIISDIHGNLEALRTVLADIDRRSVDEIVCLGDILGYGPDPLECVDLVAERCAWSLLGNHDYAVLYEPTNFNKAAKEAAYWTRTQLDEAAERDPESGNRRLDFLNRIRPRVRYRDVYICVHGSVRKPINEYLFETDVTNDRVKIKDVFRRIDDQVALGDTSVCGRCLVGHTHVPGIFNWSEEDGADFTHASNLGGGAVATTDPLELGSTEGTKTDSSDDPFLVGRHLFDPSEKAIANPGSVGQPRDFDERASYAILDTTRPEHQIDFFRLPYDIDSVAEKIYAISELDDWLGDRLTEGR